MALVSTPWPIRTVCFDTRADPSSTYRAVEQYAAAHPDRRILAAGQPVVVGLAPNVEACERPPMPLGVDLLVTRSVSAAAAFRDAGGFAVVLSQSESSIHDLIDDILEVELPARALPAAS